MIYIYILTMNAPMVSKASAPGARTPHPPRTERRWSCTGLSGAGLRGSPWPRWRSPRANALAVAGLIATAAATAHAAPDPDERAAILAPASRFDAAERWERLSGGSATNRRRFDRDAFSQPSANISFEARAEFAIGNALFRRLWVTAPSSTRSADGLGPLYNARACQRCHLKDGRGHPPENAQDSTVSMLIRLSVPPRTEAERARLASGREAVIPEPTYGTQLQDVAVPGLAAEGRIRIAHVPREVALAGGATVTLEEPHYAIADPGYGPLDPRVMTSPRVAPPMIGLGLLEAIAESDVMARVDPGDADGDGISGRARRVWSPSNGRMMLGRFGWKAGAATIVDQSAAAMSGDIGVSNPLAPAPWGECTERQRACRAGPHGADPGAGADSESGPDSGADSDADSGTGSGAGSDSGSGLRAGSESGSGSGSDKFEAPAAVMDAIVFYSRNLAVPARRGENDPAVLRGKALFYRSGCIGCHTPKHATRADWPVEPLAGQLIWPYTDLLVHDMGEGLADGRPEGGMGGHVEGDAGSDAGSDAKSGSGGGASYRDSASGQSGASGREWRTAPLWGIGLTEVVNGHTRFLHDGRARNLTEAILWHGGEAQASRDVFRTMPKAERDALLAFLKSL